MEITPAHAAVPEVNSESPGDIVIAHTNAEGTLISGTARGDGSREALRSAGFRWSRSLGVWYLRQSRGFAARRDRIDRLTAVLRDAGFTVTVDIETYDPARTFQARQDASQERSDAHATRAVNEQARYQLRSEAAHAAVAQIPLGQPILVGHHSEARHRRDLARHDRNMGRAIEHADNAKDAARRSDSVRAQAAARQSPVVMGRKIERLTAEQRKLTRYLTDATEGYAEQLRERLAVIEEDIAFLQGEIERSGARVYTKADIAPDDLVRIRGRWMIVVKANSKTVAVKTGYSWSDNYPYHEVSDHRRPTAEEPS